MNEDEGIHAALGDQPGSQHGFPESGGGREHAGIVPQHRDGGSFLVVAQGPPESMGDGGALAPLVLKCCLDAH